MNTLWQDVRLAIRRLRRSPTFVATVLVTLALGIGATTAVFSVVDAILLRPLPFDDPETLVEVRMVNSGGAALLNHRYDAFVRFREERELFQTVEGYAQRSMVLVGADEPVSVNVVPVTGGVMSTLGIRPRLGRAIDANDAQPGRQGVLVLSDGLWRKRFGSDPSIVGRTVRLDEAIYEIVGVMPPDFKFPRSTTEAWTALPIAPSQPVVAGGTVRPSGFMTLARLAPGISVGTAHSRMQALTPAFASTMPRGDDWSLSVQRFNEHRANPGARQAIWVLFGAVSLLLLIGCANVANLVIARGASRERELAIRAAVGASRWRLIREVLTETLLLAIVGGTAGVAVAFWWTRVLLYVVPRDLTFLSLSEITIDSRVLTFAAVMSIVSAMVVAIVPAIRIARADVQGLLKSSTRAATASSRQRTLVDLVVVAEVALSLALLVGAGLLIRTFTHVTRIDPGFEARNIVAFSMELPAWKYVTVTSTVQFWDALIDRVGALPGIAGVTVTPGLPPGAGGIMFDLRIEAEGNPDVIEDPQLELPTATVRPEFFRLMGIPLVAGRTFSSDDTPQAPPSIIINQAMARRLWPKGNAVDGRVRFEAELAGRPGDGRWYTVVGVVGNVYQFDHAKGRDAMAIYRPASQSPSGGPGRYQTLAVRTQDDPRARIADIRSVIRALEPDQPILKIETVDDAYAQFLAAPRFNAVLMGILAGLSLLMAVVGLYGVIAYATAQRTSEFGLRVALGAERRDVLTLVLRHGLAVVGAGIVIGIGGALIATRTLARLLVGVTPLDPGTYATVATTLVVGGLLACWIPARRALGIDPVAALRQE